MAYNATLHGRRGARASETPIAVPCRTKADVALQELKKQAEKLRGGRLRGNWPRSPFGLGPCLVDDLLHCLAPRRRRKRDKRPVERTRLFFLDGRSVLDAVLFRAYPWHRRGRGWRLAR